LLETRWLFNDGIDHKVGRSGKRLAARLGTVHLQHVGGDVDSGVVINVLETKTGIASGYVETGDELRGGFVAGTCAVPVNARCLCYRRARCPGCVSALP
jgi:hypothetical protein